MTFDRRPAKVRAPVVCIYIAHPLNI